MLWLQHSSFPEKRGTAEKGNAVFTLVASVSRQLEGRLVLQRGWCRGGERKLAWQPPPWMPSHGPGQGTGSGLSTDSALPTPFPGMEYTP